MPDNRLVHRVAAIAVMCALFVSSAKAVRELVTIDELQPAQRVEGVVLDPSGAPIPNMTVTDRSNEWAAIGITFDWIRCRLARKLAGMAQSLYESIGLFQILKNLVAPLSILVVVCLAIWLMQLADRTRK